MELFRLGNFTAHSGQELSFKIECDALSDKDLRTLAALAARRLAFSEVMGVPQGGILFASFLERYTKKDGPLLIVDDVLTTGNSMETARRACGSDEVIGLVIFARGPCPSWIKPIFSLSDWV